jgi:general secretion pathway protein G
MKKHTTGGFTLIELLITIAIIGILSSIVLASTYSVRPKARDAARKAELYQIVLALELYYDTYHVYPPIRPSSSCGGYRSDFATSYCTQANWMTTDGNFLKYLASVPKDPSNTLGNDDTPWWQALTYTYGVSTDEQSYDLLTNLENTGDIDRCEIKVWKSQVLTNDTGCWSNGVLPRSKQIYSVNK